MLSLALFALIARVPALSQSASETSSHVPTEIEQLRELESAVVRLIEAANPAFAFIQGGSGFCISEDGLVLTNDHVVANADQVTVTLTGGNIYRAKVLGRDRWGDVALLKLEGASGLRYLELGDSDALRIGQRVVALGDPFLVGSQNLFIEGVPPSAFEPSASLGIVSALHRYSDRYSDAIQVDLAVNRGNSGGPLLTLDGKVVGINGKIETRFNLGINTGVGYAIPSNQIRRFLKPLEDAEGGEVAHGTIRGLEVAERANDQKGLPVAGVRAGSPAEGAGFRQGDLILELGGFPVRTRSRYLGVLGTYPAGERVGVLVARGDEELELSAVLVLPGRPYLGVRTLLAEGEGGGARITNVGRRTPAAKAGLQVEDVIVGFEGAPVASPTDLAQLIRKKEAGEVVRLRIRRGSEEKELEVRLGGRAE